VVHRVQRRAAPGACQRAGGLRQPGDRPPPDRGHPHRGDRRPHRQGAGQRGAGMGGGPQGQGGSARQVELWRVQMAPSHWTLLAQVLHEDLASALHRTVMAGAWEGGLPHRQSRAHQHFPRREACSLHCPAAKDHQDSNVAEYMSCVAGAPRVWLSGLGRCRVSGQWSGPGGAGAGSGPPTPPSRTWRRTSGRCWRRRCWCRSHRLPRPCPGEHQGPPPPALLPGQRVRGEEPAAAGQVAAGPGEVSAGWWPPWRRWRWRTSFSRRRAGAWWRGWAGRPSLPPLQ
jgi:hypothetical protein